MKYSPIIERLLLIEAIFIFIKKFSNQYITIPYVFNDKFS